MTEPHDAAARRADSPASAATTTARPELRRALDRLAGLRALDAAIIRAGPIESIAAAALRHLRSLVATKRASVIAYDLLAGTGTLIAVDEDVVSGTAAARSTFPLEAIVPAGLLSKPRTRVYDDIATQLADLQAARMMVSLGYRAALWSPMVADGALMGMVAVAAEDASLFEGDVIEIVDEIAGQLAIAVRGEREREATRRSTQRLAFLHDVDRAILDAESLGDLARRAAGLVCALVSADRVVIARYEPDRGIGYRLASARVGETSPEETLQRVPLDHLLAPSMLDRPETMVMRDLAAEAGTMPGVRYMLDQGLAAGVFAPLVAHGVLQGGLIVGWRDRARLTDEHVAITTEVADQLAIAVLHAHAHERLERQADRLELVHDIDRAILSATHPQEIAERVVEQLRRLAGADRVAVLRFDLARGVSRLLAWDAADRSGNRLIAPDDEAPIDQVAPTAVLEQHEIARLPDLAAVADSLPGVRPAVDSGMRAGAIVPLVAGDLLVGAIALSGRDATVLAEANLDVAREVADQLVLAILQADARERAERTAVRLALVHEVDAAILASESAEDLAGRVAGPLARLAGARRLDISTYDLERDEGRILAFAHDGTSSATPVGTVYPLRAVVPMASTVAPTLAVYDDLEVVAASLPLARAALAAGLTRAAWIPLVAGDRLLGAIGMAGDDPAMLGRETLELAREIGDQVAVALQHVLDREQLAEREHRLRAILEGSPNGILGVDAAGIVQYANPSAHRLFGASAGELAGRPHVSLIPPSAVGVHPAHLEQWFRDPEATTTHPLDTEAMRLDGTLFPVHVLLARVETTTEPLAIATVVDLSERTALETRLRQAERLETLGQFAGILAHDVRNYLTAVTWSAELLESELGEDDRHAEDVRMIRRATQDAVDMTRTVLEFARPTGDPTGALDVGAHLRGTRSMLARILGDGIRLAIEIDPDLPQAAINATAMTQVLGNLASNARDAMPDGGRVTIRALRHGAQGVAEAGIVEPGPYVRLVVADTGVGMDEDTRGRAFEAFYTTKTMASTARGTGLGLSSVFLIVTRAGGAISVSSAPGEGTTFTVDLPALA